MPESEIDVLLAKLAATPRRKPPLHLRGTRRFELRRRLGSGAFGDVYEAYDREHGTQIALKSLKSSDPDWIYRFKSEFRIVGDLAHPNLVRLYELLVEDDRWYLTMEMIYGLRFDEHLRRAPGALRSCFAQLARGISELHRAHCLHCDLKPSNALVETTGRVVLVDFGLAVRARGSRPDGIGGTPPYMAPELGVGQAPSEASDWYAFGVMLYEALAGVLPFAGDEVEMLQRKLREGAPAAPPAGLTVDPALWSLALGLLAPDPEARPSAAAIVAELIGAELGFAEVARRHAPTRSPFVGRRRPLAQLDDALASSVVAPTVVTVRGIPGIGKTALVETFFDQVRGAHAQIYQGRCLELESVPFKGVDGVIDTLCNDLWRRESDDVRRVAPGDVHALTRMFPMLKRVDAFSRSRPSEVPRSAHELRHAGSQALRELLGNLSAPVILFIDDMQWSGDDSLRLLLELLTPPAPSILVILAFRPELGALPPPLGRFLAALRERGVAPIELELPPLEDADVAAWLASITHASISIEDAMRETGGHPHLLSRLIQYGGQGADRSADLSTVLADEIAELDSDARAVLALVSIAGRPIRPEAVFAAVGIPKDPATIDQLRRRNLIQSLTTSSDTKIEAYHDRVREAALASLSASQRRDLHGRIAQVLESSELADAETLARHFREAGEIERALTWTQRAAEHAIASLAFARVVELYSQAIALALSPAQRLDVLDALAGAQVQYGRRSDAARTCLDAAELARQLGRASVQATLRARAGEHFLFAGQLERGLDLIRDALASVDVVLPSSPAVAVAESFNLGGRLAVRGLGFQPRVVEQIDPRLLQRLELELEVTRSLALTDIRAPLLATRALLDALDAGEPHRVQRALAYYVHAISARSPGDPLVIEAEACAHVLAGDLDTQLGSASAELATGFHAWQRHEHLLALDALDRAEREFRACGPAHAREAMMARLTGAMICGNYGLDIHRARARLAGCIDDALERGDVFNATWAQLTDCQLALTGGDVALARTRLAQVRATWPRAVDSLFSVGGLANEISIALYDEPATAWSTLSQIEPEYRQLFSSMMPFSRELWCRLAGNAAMAAWRAGHADRSTTTDRIEALIEEAALVEPRRSGHCVLASHRCSLEGDRRARVALLEEAAALWADHHQRVFELLARVRIHGLREDDAAREGTVVALMHLGVVEPERLALLFVGPT